ncbi:Six-hairpin glycosidase [Daedalea quercina L-15889]|uniref:Six-hairpin glycosidase n=1 Tax=Daedalea quercina L-15889 TaxID=1314783 RepID=A0A165LP74_9APHY|nr:Six-hairpin glycosidase [Daedalea quercina L-15889]
MPGLAFAAVSALLGASFFTVPRVHAQSLTDAQLDDVKDNLWLGAQQTWELGTEAQALLESDAPAYSVFSDNSLPPPLGNDSALYNNTAVQPVIQIAYNVAYNRSNSTGPQPIMYVEGGAAGDPVSIGVALLIANWTGAPEPELNRPEAALSPYGESIGQGVTYARAAEDQLEYILTVVPRADNGAISHRIETTQLWSDAVYMIPPFLAYYGVLTGNQTLVEEAYNQIKAYREILFNSTTSLWQHILLGDNGIVDPDYWATGNGWAAAGILRVLATIKRSQYADSMASELNDLLNWVVEIHDGMYKYQDNSTSLFHNYAENSTWFFDSSSSALLASTVYRLATLQGIYTYIPNAEAAREALSANSGSDTAYTSWGTGNGVGPATSFTQTTATSATPSGTATSSYAVPTPTSGGEDLLHFTPQMWLTPVVDPYDFTEQGGSSPEGQAFIVEMYAAWRDWVELGSPGLAVTKRDTAERRDSSRVLGRFARMLW